MSWLALHIYFRSFVLLALFMGGMQVLFIIPPSMSNGTWWVPDPVSLGLGFAFPTGVMAFAVTHRIMEWMNQRAYRYGTPLPRSSDLGWVTRRRRAEVQLPFNMLDSTEIVERALRENRDLYNTYRDSMRQVVSAYTQNGMSWYGGVRVRLGAVPGNPGATQARIEFRPGLRFFLVDFGFGKEIVESIAHALNTATREHFEAQRRQAEEATMRAQMQETRLNLLQAQVEPHFLYNTLANLQALIRSDPEAADQMTGDLIGYLRLSMPEFRAAGFTLGRELELVRAYLNIMKIRLRDRLAFSIHAEESAAGVQFPPLLVHTMVENAIKHGIEPRPGGGEVAIDVARLGNGEGRLRIAVTDTGVGLETESQGSGVGLANLRERIELLYGKRARFAIAPNEPHGVACTLEIPIEEVAVR